eukprot:7544285-Pyramimonas_sp.AAC.1
MAEDTEGTSTGLTQDAARLQLQHSTARAVPPPGLAQTADNTAEAQPPPPNGRVEPLVAEGWTEWSQETVLANIEFINAL